jgi:hypothetical protein
MNKPSLLVSEGDGGSRAPLIEAGTYLGICYGIIHVGNSPDTYNGETYMKNRLRLLFEIPSETHVFDEERGAEPRVMSKEFTFVISDNSHLKKDLQSWRGKPFTPEELKGFNIFNVIGAPCMLSISVKTSKKSNREYNLINGISKVMKGLDVPNLHQELLMCHYDYKQPEFHFSAVWDKLPKYIRAEIKKTEEYAAAVEVARSESGHYTEQIANAILATVEDETEENSQEAPKQQQAAAPQKQAEPNSDPVSDDDVLPF